MNAEARTITAGKNTKRTVVVHRKALNKKKAAKPAKPAKKAKAAKGGKKVAATTAKPAK